MALRVSLIQGGGAGFDQVPAVQRILKEAGVAIDWHEHLAGQASLERGDVALPPAMLQSVHGNGIALKTKLLSPPGKESNFNVQFRRELGLFASVRPLKNLRGLPARFDGVDFLVIRELTEDLYTAIEHEIVPGVVQSIKVVTEAASRRFFRFALQWARAQGRKTVHCVHKANIMKLADGLFLEAFRAVATEFPELTPKEIIVDNCCMQMVLRPQQFDVLVMGNLYGDLVSDLGAGVVGGISATHGINVGDGVCVYETFHGGSREAIPAGRANPLPLLLPALDLLTACGETQAAGRILSAVEKVLVEARVRPADLGGSASTNEIADAIVAALPGVRA
jgi:isocitrate dehydrogenase (NAD+)